MKDFQKERALGETQRVCWNGILQNIRNLISTSMQKSKNSPYGLDIPMESPPKKEAASLAEKGQVIQVGC
jgi:hypothetical protein